MLEPLELDVAVPVPVLVPAAVLGPMLLLVYVRRFSFVRGNLLGGNEEVDVEVDDGVKSAARRVEVEVDRLEEDQGSSMTYNTD